MLLITIWKKQEQITTLQDKLINYQLELRQMKDSMNKLSSNQYEFVVESINEETTSIAVTQTKTGKVKKFFTCHGSTDNLTKYMLSLTDEQFKLMFGAK